MELEVEVEAAAEVLLRQSRLECPSALVSVALQDVQVEAAAGVLAMPMRLVWT